MSAGTEALDSAVVSELNDHTLVLRINRPKALNAINCDVSRGIAEGLLRAESDPDIRAVVITGTGPDIFSAGADLKALSRNEPLTPADPQLAAFGFAGCTERKISVPVIAAVNGAAYGGGVEIALAADIVVADPKAIFALPEVKRGLFAGAGGVFRLPRQLPAKVANWMILTGEPLGAEAALSYGLVSLLAPEGQALDTALNCAAQISANAPLAIGTALDIARQPVAGIPADELAAWQMNTQAKVRIENSHDAGEGARAFIEKRKPEWLGR